MNNKSLINWHWQLNTEAVIPVAVVAWYETVPRLLIYLLFTNLSFEKSR